MEASAKAYVRAVNNAAAAKGSTDGTHDRREDPGPRRRARRGAARATSSRPRSTWRWPTTSRRRWPSPSSRRPASPRSSTPRRSPWCPTTSRPTRTSRRPRRARSMREFARTSRHRALLGGRPRRHRARAAARTGPGGARRRRHRRRLATPAPTAPWPPFRPASARPTSRPPWPGAGSGCACPRPSGSSITASRRATWAARTSCCTPSA